MSDEEDWLPSLVALSDAGGVWKDYLAKTYETFRRDFIVSQPKFRGHWVRCRRDPIDAGMEWGFWHCTSEGAEEANRIPSLRRCERIAWVRAIIENEADERVDWWENERRGETRSLLWFREEYLVILAHRARARDRFFYYQLVSAYDTTEEHRKRKLRQERDDFWKRRTPPLG